MSDYDLIKQNARNALRGNWAISIALILAVTFLEISESFLADRIIIGIYLEI